MKKILSRFVGMIIFTVLALNVTCYMAHADKNDGAFKVIEGKVSTVTTRSLTIDGQQYPISIFVKAFDKSLQGTKIPMHIVVNMGKIDSAKLFLIGGKVEKIVVIKNL